MHAENELELLLGAPVLILDESDMSVQTETRNVSKTEKAIETLIQKAFQVILVTATPFANVFTMNGHGRVAELPMKPAPGGDQSLHYYGISQKVPKERQPRHIVADVAKQKTFCQLGWSIWWRRCLSLKRGRLA